ncbi:MAG TPA: hypothetical protein VGD80_23915, partial [Kofleriaceae bacterium]
MAGVERGIVEREPALARSARLGEPAVDAEAPAVRGQGRDLLVLVAARPRGREEMLGDPPRHPALAPRGVIDQQRPKRGDGVGIVAGAD